MVSKVPTTHEARDMTHVLASRRPVASGNVSESVTAQHISS